MTLKILLAEDIPATREAISVRLNLHPELEVVASFATVAESNEYLAKENSVDVLFLDVRLKDDYAWEILHQLQDKNKPIPPVVLITAEEEKGYAETVFRKFSDVVVDYFVKPFGKKWRERQNECVIKIKARLQVMENELTPELTPESGSVQELNKFLELTEGITSHIISKKILTHIVLAKYITEDHPIEGIYLYTSEQAKPYYGQQYKSLSKIIKKLDPNVFIKGDRGNLINYNYVNGFTTESRQMLAIVGPLKHKVNLSENGEKRIRQAMGL